MFSKRNKLYFNNQAWVFSPRRIGIWRNFVGTFENPVLVFGIGNFEKEAFPNAKMVETEGDYNDRWFPKNSDVKYKTVFCFEVLEHLCNPLLFLETIKLYIDDGVDIFLSFPSGRPQWLWTNEHFHEYGKTRAEKLFEMAGYKIIKSEKTAVLWPPLRRYFTGIRPMFRLLFPLRCRLYQLRKLNI